MKKVLKSLCVAFIVACSAFGSLTATEVTTEPAVVTVEAKKLTTKQKKAIAKKYKGKSIKALVRKIGRYSRGQINSSCNSAGYYEGLYQWKGFKVRTRSKGKGKKNKNNQIIVAVK